jgi:hypothetical protein
VQQLLQKLQPDSISLQVATVGQIDKASKEVIEKEQKELAEEAISK